MNPSKKDPAQALLEAMGEINDAFLDEAIGSLCSPKKQVLPFYRKPVTKILASAAALAAVLGLVFTGAWGRFPGIGRNDSMESAREPAEQETKVSLSSLNSLLRDCTQSSLFTPTALQDLQLFDGTVRLTVRNESDGGLYVSRPLTPMEQNQLLLELEAVGTPVDAAENASQGASPEASQSPSHTRSSYSVWITLGDGQVVTPCLSVSGGNIGAGVLFDYQTERLPSAAFFNLLEAMI